jgi:hypothetical protein
MNDPVSFNSNLSIESCNNSNKIGQSACGDRCLKPLTANPLRGGSARPKVDEEWTPLERSTGLFGASQRRSLARTCPKSDEEPRERVAEVALFRALETFLIMCVIDKYPRMVAWHAASMLAYGIHALRFEKRAASWYAEGN